MARANPNIYDVAYTRCNPSNQSAARLVRYLTRRPHDKERPGRESDWTSLPEDQVFGNSEAFKQEANRRRRERVERHERRGTDIGQDHSPQNVSYIHVVISPGSREEFRAEDFGELVGPWIRDRKGRPCPWFAAVHFDDPEGPKIHLAVARDRVHKTKELPLLKERTAELIREREKLLELERSAGMVRSGGEREQEAPWRESSEPGTLGLDPETAREHPREEQTVQDGTREEHRDEEQPEEESSRHLRQSDERESRRREEDEQERREVEERRRQREAREDLEREEDEHEREM